MLVLTRGKDECIKIGDDITVMVVRIDAETVRLGISAPKDTTIHRQEVYDAIKTGEPRRPKLCAGDFEEPR